MDRTAPERIPPHLRVLLGANFVSEVGSGLTLPFLLIYLHDVRHIPLGIAGLLIGGASIVSVPIGPATGVLVDRLGPRAICVASALLNTVGAASLVLVRGPVSAIPVMLLYGLANGSTWPSWTALFAVMVADERLRPRVFARNFQLLNLGLGIGSVVAAAIVRTSAPSSFVLVYLLDGVTFLAIVVALVLLPARIFRLPVHHADDTPAHPRGGYREVFSDRRFVRYLVSMFFLAFAGYAAVNAGLVGYATTVVLAKPYVIAWAFAANTGLIVLLQPLALRLVGRMRRTTALSVCAGFFATAWGVLALSGRFSHSVTGDALVVAMFGVFALGEVLLSPVGGPLVTMMARPSLQGRYNATASSVFTLTNVLGPAFAGAMLGARLGDAYLGVLVLCCAGAVAGFRWMRRSLSPALDNSPSARPPGGPGDGGGGEDEGEVPLVAPGLATPGAAPT